MKRRDVTRAGMTLLELIIALAITGMLAAGGVGAMATLADHRRTADEAVADATRGWAMRHAIAAWIEGARVDPTRDGPPFQLLDGSDRGAPSDELLFMTTAPTPLGAGPVVVHLFIDHDRRTAEQGLVAQIDEWRGLRSRRLVLDSAAATLDIRCETDLLSTRATLPSFMSTSVLPLGVRIVVGARRGAAVEPMLAQPILVHLEAGR